MGVIQDILVALEGNEAAGQALLNALVDAHVCVCVHPEDGYFLEHDGAAWTSVERGIKCIAGQVLDVGIEHWDNPGSVEPWLEVHSKGEAPKRVFLNGIEIGCIATGSTRMQDDQLINLLFDDLPGDDEHRLETLLEGTGFKSL